MASNFRLRLIALSPRASAEYDEAMEASVRTARQTVQAYGNTPARRRAVEKAEQDRAQWHRHDPARRNRP